MKKQKKWIAVENQDEMIAEIAFLKKQHDYMVLCINDLVKAGNEMYDLAVQDSAGIGTSRQLQRWKKISERYD